jgi:hypothetical protein
MKKMLSISLLFFSFVIANENFEEKKNEEVLKQKIDILDIDKQNTDPIVITIEDKTNEPEKKNEVVNKEIINSELIINNNNKLVVMESHAHELMDLYLTEYGMNKIFLNWSKERQIEEYKLCMMKNNQLKEEVNSILIELKEKESDQQLIFIHDENESSEKRFISCIICNETLEKKLKKIRKNMGYEKISGEEKK